MPKIMSSYFLTSTVAGNHADPNLTYARDLCDVMGVDAKGVAVKGTSLQDSSRKHIVVNHIVYLCYEEWS